MKRQVYTLLLLLVFLALFSPAAAFAHCPLCAAGAATGLTLSRALGVDDSVTGVWLGGLLASMGYWMYTTIPSKYRFPFLKEITLVVVVISTLLSFYAFNLVNKHTQIFGFDKLTFGILVGSIVFYLTDMVNGRVIEHYKRVFFPYQRVAISLLSILITSVAIYILINFYI